MTVLHVCFSLQIGSYTTTFFNINHSLIFSSPSENLVSYVYKLVHMILIVYIFSIGLWELVGGIQWTD